MIYATEEDKMWERLAVQCAKMKAIGWKRELIPHLDSPVDIVVVDKITGICESKTCWKGIEDFERAKRLVARETGQYGDSLVCAIISNSREIGEKVNNIIKI